MQKILVIEPYQILRHAFAIALSLDYEVETVAQFPAAELVKEPDLIIIDAAALQEKRLLPAEQSAMQNRKIPVIWIDGEETAQRFESVKRFRRLSWPLGREALKKAVAGCLEKAAQTGSKFAKPRAVPPSSVSEPVEQSTESPSLASGGPKKLIELVDIVE